MVLSCFLCVGSSFVCNIVGKIDIGGFAMVLVAL